MIGEKQNFSYYILSILYRYLYGPRDASQFILDIHPVKFKSFLALATVHLGSQYLSFVIQDGHPHSILSLRYTYSEYIKFFCPAHNPLTLLFQICKKIWNIFLSKRNFSVFKISNSRTYSHSTDTTMYLGIVYQFSRFHILFDFKISLFFIFQRFLA